MSILKPLNRQVDELAWQVFTLKQEMDVLQKALERRSTIEAQSELALQKRLSDLEKQIVVRAGFEGINEATSVLGQKSLKGNHNHNYLGSRFQDYELALLNIKQMGYYIGLAEAHRTGAFDKINAERTPTTTGLPSKLCTQTDCDSDWFYFWLAEMKCGFAYHRKLWEFCYIAQNLYAHGALREGAVGVGFGCGEEPLPSLFAKYGAFVTATDLDPKEFGEEGRGWVETGQHGSSLSKFLNRSICPDDSRLARIEHEFVNMNQIPKKFDSSFDFCWSACALEHVGSIELGLQFIENSMETLKPGGVAVHTTEYNLEGGETIDNCFTVLFQRRHMEELTQRLNKLGYQVANFDLDGGGGVLDGLFDIPPWPWDAANLGWRMMDTFAHLKRSIGGFTCTSIGITITKPAI